MAVALLSIVAAGCRDSAWTPMGSAEVVLSEIKLGGAAAVARVFQQQGVPIAKLYFQGAGETLPEINHAAEQIARSLAIAQPLLALAATLVDLRRIGIGVCLINLSSGPPSMNFMVK